MIRVLGRVRPSTLALWMSVPLLVSAPLRAGAQVVATSFEELKAVVKPGDTIDVTDASGKKIKGRLGELSASSLELLVRKTGPDGRDTFVPQARLSERDVQQIRLERRDSLWNGALIGFAPGAAIGMGILFGGAGCDCYTIASRAPIAFGTMLFAGGIGAVIGVAIDASMIERTTVYFRTPARRSVSLQISPRFSTSSTGIQMRVGF
jgi:hypothetical protein